MPIYLNMNMNYMFKVNKDYKNIDISITPLE